MDVISDILGVIGDILGAIWSFLVGIWDLIVNVWNLPGVVWDQLCIFWATVVVSWANVVVSWDQMPWDQIDCVSKYSLIGACFGAIGIPLATGAILLALGFLQVGILAGSIGAALMSRHGGYTPVGGTVATLQSLGTRGFAVGFQPQVMIAGGVLGLVGGGYVALFYEGYCDAPLY